MTQNNDGQEPSYEIGYKKPPKHTQFQVGHLRGNRKGRPKSAGNLSAAVRAAANKMALVEEGGRKRRIQKRELIAMQLVNKAAKGDAKSIAMVAKLDNAPALAEASQEKSLVIQKSKTPEEASAAYKAALKRAKSDE